MNGRPRLRHVLTQEIGEYENVKVEWIPGHLPTAYFYEGHPEAGGILESQIELGDWTHEEFLSNLASQGNFAPHQPLVEYPATPDAEAFFEGHRYRFYSLPNRFLESKAFCEALSTETERAYVVQLDSTAEIAFLKEFAAEHEVWLAGQRLRNSEASGADPENFAWPAHTDPALVPWAENEPNNAGVKYGATPVEDCVVLKPQGQGANDIPCKTKRSLLVESEPNARQALQDEL